MLFALQLLASLLAIVLVGTALAAASDWVERRLE